MLDFTVVFCYRIRGQEDDWFDDEPFGVFVYQDHHTSESLVGRGLVVQVLELVPFETLIKVEVYKVRFLGVINEFEDVLMVRIKDNMENMLANGELKYLGDYEFYLRLEKE